MVIKRALSVAVVSGFLFLGASPAAPSSLFRNAEKCVSDLQVLTVEPYDFQNPTYFAEWRLGGYKEFKHLGQEVNIPLILPSARRDREPGIYYFFSGKLFFLPLPLRGGLIRVTFENGAGQYFVSTVSERKSGYWISLYPSPIVSEIHDRRASKRNSEAQSLLEIALAAPRAEPLEANEEEVMLVFRGTILDLMNRYIEKTASVLRRPSFKPSSGKESFIARYESYYSGVVRGLSTREESPIWVNRPYPLDRIVSLFLQCEAVMGPLSAAREKLTQAMRLRKEWETDSYEMEWLEKIRQLLKQ